MQTKTRLFCKHICILLTFMPFVLSAQTKFDSTYNIFTDLSTTSTNGGRVNIYADSRLMSIVEQHKTNNSRNAGFQGYRIQIYSANTYETSISKVESIRNQFRTSFNTIPTYIEFINPDFKIRVGNYHSRLESLPDLKEILKIFPASYPVKEYIKLDDFEPKSDDYEDDTYEEAQNNEQEEFQETNY